MPESEDDGSPARATIEPLARNRPHDWAEQRTALQGTRNPMSRDPSSLRPQGPRCPEAEPATRFWSRAFLIVRVNPLAMTTLRVLFVCSQNKLRSPTAEQVFADYPDLECSSAGTNNDAENPLTQELVEWADVVFVMEKQHQKKLASKFQRSLRGKRVVCLGIPDDFEFMQVELVQLLEARVGPHLR
jgi:predicted protein tyrosine phosphatase